MKEILDFLTALRHNNNREWFAAHKSEYLLINAIFNDMVERLIAQIGKFDKDIAPLTVKNCVYRIYRDTRFSPDKTPYKTHIGAYLSRGGKNAGFAGYYFHLEPELVGEDGGFLGGSLLACGLHCPEPKVLKSVREDIFAQGELYQKALKKAAGFVLDTHNTLKRTPKGFPANSPYDEWLKLKDFSAMKRIDIAHLTIEECAAQLRTMQPLNDLLNRAVEYAFEEVSGS